MHCDHGANIENQDYNNQTPLFYASSNGKVEAVKFLVAKGSNVNHLDKWKENPLFFASHKGKIDTCKFLIESGTNINQVDFARQTALFFAKKGRHQSVIDLLIENGAVNTKTGKIPEKKETVRKGNQEGFNRLVEKSKASSINSNLTKRKNKAKEKMKVLYRMVFTDETGETRHLTKDEFDEFKLKYPKVCSMIMDPSLIP